MTKLSDLLKKKQPVVDPREAVYTEGDGTVQGQPDPQKSVVVRHKDLLKKKKQNAR